MALDKKISQLLNLGSITGSEFIPIELGGLNYYITPAQLAAYISGLSPAFAAVLGTNAYTCVATNLTSYSQLLNKAISVKITNANTSTGTLNINGLGAVPIKKFGNVALESGDIKAGQGVAFFYDGSSFQILSVTDNIAEGN